MHVWACTSLHTTPTPVFFYQSSCGILTLYLLLFVLVGGGGDRASSAGRQETPTPARPRVCQDLASLSYLYKWTPEPMGF